MGIKMTNRLFRIALFLLIILVTNSQSVYPLSVETHETINEIVANGTMNSFSLNGYLINNLGLSGGVNEFFDNKKVYTWFALGGRYEDIPPWTIIPYVRSVNHFHNPLKLWNEAGLNDVFTGTSSVIWAQDQSSAGISLGGDWSWKKAREYFYIALTGKDFNGNLVATDKAQRDAYFAKTFRAVGQLMHLVQDSSVPAHVRNDSHLLGEGYEEWVEDTRANNTAVFDALVATPLFFDSAILNETLNPLAPIPIAKIIDTDRYNEGINPSADLTWGISEYTNSNFASADTIFTENFDPNHKHYFPYPRYSPENYEMYDVDLSQSKKRIYLRKKGDGEPIEHFATVGPLYKHLNFDSVIQRDELEFDNEVHRDYASLLLPRAVGYSAGLLNYFFRGDLYISLLIPSNNAITPDVCAPIGNSSDTGSNIDTVAVFIRNNSKLNDAIEPIGAGTLTLTVSYKDSTGSIVYESAGSVSVTQIPEMNSSSYFSTLFTLPAPIPTQTAEDVTYYFAFRGQLGNETDAVIGKIIKGPVLHSISPDNGIEGTIVTLTGNNLPMIDEPFPATSENVRFHHDISKPYTVEVINKTDTDITVKVPNTAGLLKPGYGGLRVRNILNTGEKIYSNPVFFFPIAQGEVRNSGQTVVDITVEATNPITGDYNQLPQTININGLAPGASQPIQLMTGFTYAATANSTVTKDIELLTPNAIDFVFELHEAVR
ncbi:MAG: hypothetical protein HY806_00440 [Nitrospirae bacterium]|nr:hypothetical protein [Nitrospirota bacterium]